MNEEDVVCLRGVEKERDRFVFGPVDLLLQRGFVYAIVGTNGSGKSTLFRMLLNLVIPDRGEIALFSRSYPSDNVAIKRRIGYVSELPEMFDDTLTCSQVAQFVEEWYPTWNRERFHSMVREYGLDLGKKLKDLSKGNQRKLAYILALAPEPELLLLDELTSGMDPIVWRKVMDELSEYMESGERTILFASHHMDEVRRLADYVIIMSEGRIVSVREKDELLGDWKIFWVDSGGTGIVPGASGIVQLEEERGAIRLVSRSARETEKALEAHGVRILRTQAATMDEIIGYESRYANNRYMNKKKGAAAHESIEGREGNEAVRR